MNQQVNSERQAYRRGGIAPAPAILSAALLTLGLSLLSACPARQADSGAEPSAQRSTGRPILARLGTTQTPALDFDSSLSALDKHITTQEARCAEHPQSWPDLEGLACSYERRAALGGDHEDYERAQAAIEQAFAAAPRGSGPFMTRASLNFSMHRVKLVEADLQAAEKAILIKDPVKAQIAGLRADSAYYSSHYAEAAQLYQQALSYGVTGDLLSRMADMAWRTGDSAKAKSLLMQAQSLLSPTALQASAFIELQLGNLEQDCGNYTAAQTHYDTADAQFPGWWLVAEAKSRNTQLCGDEAAALAQWKTLAESSGQPEFQDQLALAYYRKGDVTNGDWYSALARAQYEDFLHEFPEAGYGHAINHYLAFSTDTKFVVELARKGVEARPNGLGHVKLAQALLQDGQYSEARQVIEGVLVTPYRSPIMHSVAAKIYDKLGESSKAQEQRVAALAINPGYPALDDLNLDCTPSNR